ncbi:LPS-assembly lipoprotein LptE [Ideonella livida]|uniref:LPS-assembly lipoprotein LptE n=1 Tax=Ideonella livida TaxID=2707176 RepID=A0A7C9TMW0_9BURK|nr:LPS assembly lipoprotein LptE [Ideonella livida]NDY91986.1 hypothetical protein [Ideonella livida]
MSASLLSRRLGAGLLLGLAAALLGACGFQLRGPVDPGFSRIALAGFTPRSPMAEALRRSLPERVQVVGPAQAQLLVTALEDRFTRTVAATTASGQVRELTLTTTLRYRLSRPGQEVLVEETTLSQTRSLSYTEDSALAKSQEEAQLLREMRHEIAGQLLRVMATVAARPAAASAPA